MPFRVAVLLTMVLLVWVPALHAAGKKEDKATVSFHIETEATDNPKMIFPQLVNGQTRYFRRVPEVILKDVHSFSPFASDFGGGDYGLLLVLKAHAAKRLSAISTVNQGRWMISQVNGRVVDGVLIDKPVNDGRLVIWKGVTLADIALFDKALPRTGQEGNKKKP